jgi:cytoskeletal protein CcmA (bactofilin family)
VAGGPAPSLEVAAFEVSEGALRVGGEATLEVRIANRGPGTAYRVVATTRSSITSLHGLRLSFGTIKPGSDKLRKLRVTVPASETSSDTMLVLVVGEGNGFVPRNVSHRMPIQAIAVPVVLALKCSIAGRSAARPELDAGDNLVLHCTVGNAGASATKIALETSVARAAPTRSAALDLAAGAQVSFDVPVAISRDLALDSTVEIAVTAHDTVFGGTERASVVGIVRKPKVCTAGQLTGAQYRSKITELRAAVVAGDLTQAQLDRYDAELVACLQ